MERSWIGTNNLFLPATKTSYMKTVVISTHTDSWLGGDVGVPALYNYYHPLHEALINAYDGWRIQLDSRIGSTNSLKNIFDELATKVGDWDIAIQTIYRKGSSDYIRLMPRGRGAFSKGKQVMRIHALSQLSQVLASEPHLVAVKTEVDQFYASLMSINRSQKDNSNLANTKSHEVEAARIACCKGLQFVQSGLVQHFIDNPTQANKYFRLDLIRNIRQKAFRGRVAPGGIKDIMNRAFKPTDLIDLDNPGFVDLEFYFSPNKNGVLLPGAVPLTVHRGTSVQVAAASLGNVSNTFLMVRNPSPLVEGVWMVGV